MFHLFCILTWLLLRSYFIQIHLIHTFKFCILHQTQLSSHLLIKKNPSSHDSTHQPFMQTLTYWCVLRREWIGMGVAGMIITSDDWDHSRKFPAFSTIDHRTVHQVTVSSEYQVIASSPWSGLPRTVFFFTHTHIYITHISYISYIYINMYIYRDELLGFSEPAKVS
jgi:hypothetical protein